ncbi:MAG: hypothetical protein ACRENS_06485, partial [Candidatus Eiseniibacteriota bacterium]
ATIRAESWLLIALVALAIWDTWRLGFYADDFIFLDAVHRHPPLQVLLGQHGIRPWYRPLSAIAYFYAIAAAGPLGAPLARLISGLCLAALVFGTFRNGERLVGSRAAAFAAGALAVAGASKMMVGWASEFQDLLAITLMVWAVELHASGRRAGSLALAGLAAFAKESGFLAFPLLAGYAWIAGRPRPTKRWWVEAAAVLIAAIAIHLAARSTWTAVAHRVRSPFSPFALEPALRALMADLAPGPLALGAPALLALAAAGMAWPLMSARSRDSATTIAATGAWGFITLALMCGLSPLIASAAAGLYSPAARFALPALPWLALAAGAALARLPRRMGAGIAAAWIGLQVWTFSYQAPNLDRAEGWKTEPLGWREAVRIDARTRRLSADLRRELAGRPESTVVLYGALPSGSWFQTMDGPATRVVLKDATVRAYSISDAPLDTRSDRSRIAEYDPEESHHLHLVPDDCDLALRRAANALVQERPRAARAWACYCLRADTARTFARYLDAAAMLELGGAEAFRRALAGAGLLDSTRAAARPDHPAFAGTPALERAFSPALLEPRSAVAHGRAAARLSALGVDLLAAVEYRIAERLAPLPDSARAQLARILAEHGLDDQAADGADGSSRSR